MMSNQQTPLHLAAKEGNINELQRLITQGAKVNAKNSDGNGPLWFAVYFDHADCVAALAQAGADLDNLNDNGATALMLCASTGKRDMAALLLELGADRDLCNKDGLNALEHASTAELYRLLRP